MTEHFTIRVEARFEAAHNLRQYKGKSEPLHGHSWKVEAKFQSEKLDHEDIALDYVQIEEHLRKLAARLDHRYINDIPPFNRLNPTSENVAKWFYGELDQSHIRQATKLIEVTVWEGPEAYVSYSKT